MLPSRLILFCSLATPYFFIITLPLITYGHDVHFLVLHGLQVGRIDVFSSLLEREWFWTNLLFPCKFWRLPIIPEWTLLISTFCRWSWDSWIPETSGTLWDSYPPPWCCPGCRGTCWQSLCKETDHKWDTREGLFTHTNWHRENENYRCSCPCSGWNWTSKLPQVFCKFLAL